MIDKSEVMIKEWDNLVVGFLNKYEPSPGQALSLFTRSQSIVIEIIENLEKRSEENRTVSSLISYS